MKHLIDIIADELYQGKMAYQHAKVAIIPLTYYEKAMFHTTRAAALAAFVSAAEDVGMEHFEMPPILTYLPERDDASEG